MPNPAHLHLILVHSAPTMFWMGFLLLLISYFFPREQGIRLATTIVVIMGAIGLIAAANTGEAAVDLLKGLPGMDEAAIHTHEEMGEFVFPFALASAFLVLIWFTLSRKKEQHVRGWAWWVSLLFIAGTATLATYTSSLGGKIRHPEAQAEVREGVGLSDYPLEFTWDMNVS